MADYAGNDLEFSIGTLDGNGKTKHPGKKFSEMVWILVPYTGKLLDSQLFVLAVQRARLKLDPETNCIFPMSSIGLSEIPGANLYEGRELKDYIVQTFTPIMSRILFREFFSGTLMRYWSDRIIHKVSYKEGVGMDICFHTTLFELPSAAYFAHYMTMPQDVILKFENNYAFRLYDALKARSYMAGAFKQASGSECRIRLSIADVKMYLGAVDPNAVIVRTGPRCPLEQAMSKVEQNDKKQKSGLDKCRFKSLEDFEAHALAPAVDEINRVSDLKVSYSIGGIARDENEKDICFEITSRERSFKKGSFLYPEQ